MSTNQAAIDHRVPYPTGAGTRAAPPLRRLSGSRAGWLRGPFARWPRASDAGLAVAGFLATACLMEGPDDTMVGRSIGDVPLPVLLVFALSAAALYWRRHAPLAVLGVVLVGWAVLFGTEYVQLGFVAIAALYSTGRYAAARRSSVVGAAMGVLAVNLDGITSPNPWWETAIVGTLVMSGAWYVGRRVRSRQDRAAELLREQAAEARRIVIEERTRIARELHDVVAHRVSLMTVQASGARAIAGEDPAAALAAMGAVEEAGRQALDELRHLLGVLRPDTTDADDLGPQPGLADLPRLVGQIRRAGVDASATTDGLPAALPARLDLFAYRIVQEALTNVLKHAGPGAAAAVRLRADPDGIVIEVRDDGRGAAAAVPEPDPGRVRTGGHGIVGMRERALLLGGRLDAGPRPGGGFQVVAHLPTGSEPA